MKHKTTYMVQTNLEGMFDIVQNSTNSKIVGTTRHEEAAIEIAKHLNSKTRNNENTSKEKLQSNT